MDGGVKGDPSMLLVTPTDQWLQGDAAHVTFLTYDITPDGSKPIQSYLTVTSRCSVIDDVMVEGKALSVPTELVRTKHLQDEEEYFCVRRSQLGLGCHATSVTNAKVSFAAFVYGFGDHISYALPLGAGNPQSGAHVVPPTSNTTSDQQSNEHIVYYTADIARWVVTSISIACVCVLTIFSLVLRRKLKAIAAVKPMRVEMKPRSIFP